MVALVVQQEKKKAEIDSHSSLSWGTKRLRSDAKGARTPNGSMSDGDHATASRGGQPTSPPAARALSPDHTMTPVASPAAAKLLMSLCHAAPDSVTVSEDGSAGGKDDGDEPYDDDASRRSRRSGTSRGRSNPRGAAGNAAKAAPASDPAQRYRFGPGAGQAQSSAGPGSAGARRKSCAYVGVRRRQWGTFAAEIRNQQTGAREWLGTFERSEEAAVVYDMRLRQIKGAAAKCNFPELDMNGTLVKREICPRGKSAPDRLTLLIPADWPAQVAALQGLASPPAATSAGDTAEVAPQLDVDAAAPASAPVTAPAANAGDKRWREGELAGAGERGEKKVNGGTAAEAQGCDEGKEQGAGDLAIRNSDEAAGAGAAAAMAKEDEQQQQPGGMHVAAAHPLPMPDL